MPKRLFVALMPPRPALDELAAAVQPLRAEAPTVRWSRTESWHLTLVFLGAVEETAVGLLVDGLARVAHDHLPIQLQIAGGGHFDNRVLWAGLAGDRAALRRLAESVRAVARHAALDGESKPFRGHITLARKSRGDDLGHLADRLRGFTGSPWTATELFLVESRLGAGPGRTAQHEIYARYSSRATHGPGSAQGVAESSGR